MPSGDFGFALGDVAGEPAGGVADGRVAGAAQRARGIEGGPAATQERVIKALIRRAVGNRFATMVLRLSPGGRLTHSSAATIRRYFTRGTVRRLEQGGLVLGLFPAARYEEEGIQLAPGDVLVVFSDGVSEAVNVADEEFGDDRIISCLQDHLQLDPQALLDRLLAAVRQFTKGTMQSDDITALVLRYTGA